MAAITEREDVTPYTWKLECWQQEPPQCPECGKWFPRPLRNSEGKYFTKSYNFCTPQCYNIWRDRLSQHWLPAELRYEDWEGKAEGEPPAEWRWIRDYWNKTRDDFLRVSRKQGLDLCNHVCTTFPTNSFPLQTDKRGLFCTMPAGWGTEHLGYGYCSQHGGNTRYKNRHGIKLQIQAQLREASRIMYGEPIDITPEDAIMQELYRTAGHIAWLENLIQGWEDTDPMTQYVKGAGIQKSVWMTMYDTERDRLVQVSKTAAGMGIAERRVQVIEEQGRQMAALLRLFLQDPRMNWQPTQQVAAKDVLRDLFGQIPALTTLSGPVPATVVDAESEEVDP